MPQPAALVLARLALDLRLQEASNEGTQAKAYLAGPFFNPAQLEAQQRIEAIFKATDLAFFSPRIHAGKLGPRSTPTQRLLTFQNNSHGMLEADFLFANLDWLLPEGEKVEHVQIQGASGPPENRRTLLNIPDAGTVWEMGFAWASRLPVLGFTTKKDGPINLMLACSTCGIIRGWKALEIFLHGVPEEQRNGFQWDEANIWSGEII